MDGLGKYVISIICASVISAIVIQISPNKGASGALVRMLAGLFVAVTVIAPIADFQIDRALSYLESLPQSAQAMASDGKGIADNATGEIIKQQAEAYILDKAADLGAQLQVEVILSDSMPSVPGEVQIIGDISPYARSQLKKIIDKDLGIPEERQLWN